MTDTSGNKNDYGDYIYGRAALRLLEPYIVPEALGFLKCMFLEKHDFDIFEWGAGASTIWFGNNTFGTVYAVEQSQKWADWADSRKTENVKVYYYPKPQKMPMCEQAYHSYADAIGDILYKDHNVRFISIDGERRVRNRCVANAMKVLDNVDGGIIMLDNSNWPDMQEGVALLKDWHCVDFDAPKSDLHLPHGWRTSFYISPEFDHD